MKIAVILSPQEFNPGDYAGAVTVVVDVLRATSVITTAVHHGCAQVIPVSSAQEALQHAEGFAPGQALLAGEQHAFKIAGFDLGNSPAEFVPEHVYGKTIILATGNGSKVFGLTHAAAECLTLSFLNLKAVVNRLFTERRDVFILCAGRNGSVALEDAVCAGMLAERLLQVHPLEIVPEAGAVTAVKLARQHQNDLLAMLRLSESGSYLEKSGFAADLDICARLNSIDVLPVYRQPGIKDIRQYAAAM